MKIKHILLLAVMLTLVSSAFAAKAPNVLFLMSDDLNTALSGFGHPQCKTPELDNWPVAVCALRTCIANIPFVGPRALP